MVTLGLKLEGMEGLGQRYFKPDSIRVTPQSVKSKLRTAISYFYNDDITNISVVDLSKDNTGTNNPVLLELPVLAFQLFLSVCVVLLLKLKMG